jgi:hypothetical protein
VSPRRFDQQPFDLPRPSASPTTRETDALQALTRALRQRGLTARIVRPKAKPAFVHAANAEVSELTENVTCGPGGNGQVWFVWSWGEPIAPVADVARAAERVGHILTPRGTQ